MKVLIFRANTFLSIHLGINQNCHHFHEHTHAKCMLGGKGSRDDVCFLKMSFMVHRDFEKMSKHQHFQSTLLVRRGVTKKSTVCMLYIMLTLLDDLLL